MIDLYYFLPHVLDFQLICRMKEGAQIKEDELSKNDETKPMKMKTKPKAASFDGRLKSFIYYSFERRSMGSAKNLGIRMETCPETSR